VTDRTLPAPGRRRFVVADAHECTLSNPEACSTRLPAWGLLLEELDLVFRVQLDDGLLPVGQPAVAEAVTALLAQPRLRPHLLDAHVEQLLDRRLDLRLVRPQVDLERVGVVVLLRGLVRALFGDERLEDDLVRLQLWAAPLLPGYVRDR